MFVIKKVLTADKDNEPLTKRLMNYISNNDLKNSSYNTIGKGSGCNDYEKGYGIGKGNNNNNRDNRDNFNSNNNNTAKNNDREFSGSDSLSNYIEKEAKEKISKLIRFGVDYCRASPNISLINNKSLLEIGWRAQKYSYDVQFETVNFKSDKLTVFNILIFLI